MQVKTDYNVAIKKKYPANITVIIAGDKSGKYSPTPIGWAMVTSADPPMFAVSVGNGQYLLECIRHSKAFTVAYPSELLTEQIIKYGTNSGRNIDKLKEYPAKTEPASQIDSIILSDAAANFECVLEQEMITGDHCICVGRIVASHMNDDEDINAVYSFKDNSIKPVL